jgi:YbgC/YbaW family acyl-CoA thioester hydrolase
MSHAMQLKPRFYELDPYDHVNHSVYIQYFETARIEWLESVGFGLDALKLMGRQIVVVKISTSFTDSAVAGDELTVTTEVADVRRATVSWRQQITRGDDVIATQLMEAAMTDENGRPTRWLPELLSALGVT